MKQDARMKEDPHSRTRMKAQKPITVFIHRGDTALKPGESGDDVMIKPSVMNALFQYCNWFFAFAFKYTPLVFRGKPLHEVALRDKTLLNPDMNNFENSLNEWESGISPSMILSKTQLSLMQRRMASYTQDLVVTPTNIWSSNQI